MVFAADVSVLVLGERSVQGPRDHRRRQMGRKQGRFEEAEADVDQKHTRRGDMLHKCHIYGSFYEGAKTMV